ncbi:hypothetical protein N7510_005938 [Penicillium lagena]|uniref:uncharacterized protein n=1 Tax=Penicillium lagena TaxID=94218 RepID=UPI0025420910|nr:uncharacterized protein N7510_005938 [Penicillium lagena]KAJ5612744.1 hypothetical protein N7510_005938 [Penicillium lagena]
MASPPANGPWSSSGGSSSPRKKSRWLNSRSKGYTSLQDTPSDGDPEAIVDDRSHPQHHAEDDGFRGDNADTTPASGDGSSSDEDANVKLLPNKKQLSSKAPSQQTPAAAGEETQFIDVPREQRNVGDRIERLLRSERNALSDSFNTDLEDADSLDNSLILSDDEDDGYGVPLDKGDRDKWERQRRIKRGYCGSVWRRCFRVQSWWQIFFLVSIGLVMMWLAMKGLRRFRRGKAATEYRPLPWYPTPLGGTSEKWHESYSKAEDLVGEMSLLEKVNITTGTGWQMGLCVGNTGPAERMNFPSLCLQDGPLGLRYAENITAFPAGITTGATWNRKLMWARGFAMGLEAKLKGVNVLLGPSMGALGMMPAGGRNWEGFGSDPILQGVAAAETIRGIQRNGVMATAKHFVLNEQEHFRQPNAWGIPSALSSNIDDRALHEVFIWPFAESVRADVASVMCSYQMVNNSYACENSKLLNGILKDELGFQGFVQSDWLAQRSGVHSALGGLDMSMPGDGLIWADGNSLWGSQLTRAVLNTSVPIDRLNDMVSRIVAAWYHFRQDSWELPPPDGEGGPNFSSWTHDRIGHLYEGSPGDETTGVVNHFVNAQGHGEHAHSHIARKVAAEGTVLLKNTNGTLPLSREISKPGGKYRVGIYGEDAGPGKGPNACPDRGCNQGTLAEGWGSGAVNFPYLVSPWEALESAWPSNTVDTQGYLTNNVAIEDLIHQDLCLVFANSDGGEGFIEYEGIAGDRNDLLLQKNGAHLVETVAKNCGGGQGRTVVIVHAVGPVVMESWVDLPGVHAIIYANLPGQESGNALKDVLFGDVDASGRLPYTIGRSLEDYGPGAQVLYETHDSVPQVNLNQALYIDYRYFDRYNITPRFEFGFGLSYTTFNFSSLHIEPLMPKSRFPSSRPKDEYEPPVYDNSPESPIMTMVPPWLRVIPKYIYPYLTSLSGTDPGDYPYPDGYNDKQPPSPAGGGPGGNPFLYEAMLELSVNVTNTGARAGQEVIQVYVSFPDNVVEHRSLQHWTREAIDFPVRVLRNFEKVSLQPGETTTVNMTLSRKDLSYWSVRSQNWILPTEGSFRIWVGRSSRDLPLVAEF